MSMRITIWILCISIGIYLTFLHQLHVLLGGQDALVGDPRGQALQDGQSGIDLHV